MRAHDDVVRRGPRAAAVTALALGLAVSAAGCALVAQEDSSTVTAPDESVAAPMSTASVTVGGRATAARCVGSEKDPSVLLVSGYDTELSESWDAVQPDIGAFARVCAYDRWGVGTSDDPPKRQTVADLADQLDEVIDTLDLTRPVVLVAHSLGGVIAATWAEEHQQDLAGLVFVDATPPSFIAAALEILPTKPAAPGGELRAGLADLLSPRANAENLAGRTAFDPPASFSPLGSQPVLVLAHSISEWGDLRPSDAAALDSAWTGGQQAWVALSGTARLQIVDLAGHFIQNDQPTVVVDAVREVVAAP